MSDGKISIIHMNDKVWDEILAPGDEAEIMKRMSDIAQRQEKEGSSQSAHSESVFKADPEDAGE